jgi:hypothetical protein
MAAKKRGVERVKKMVKPAKRKVAGKVRKPPAKGKRPVARPAKRAAKPAARKVAPKAARKVAARRAPSAAPAQAAAPVTAATLEVVKLEPLRAEASAAFARGETVLLKTGTGEEGIRVETLLFAPSGKGAQSSGVFVHRGDWSGERLVTDKGHLLDLDGNCFCRDCEAAKGYTLDDDE